MSSFIIFSSWKSNNEKSSDTTTKTMKSNARWLMTFFNFLRPVLPEKPTLLEFSKITYAHILAQTSLGWVIITQKYFSISWDEITLYRCLSGQKFSFFFALYMDVGTLANLLLSPSQHACHPLSLIPHIWLPILHHPSLGLKRCCHTTNLSKISNLETGLFRLSHMKGWYLSVDVPSCIMLPCQCSWLKKTFSLHMYHHASAMRAPTNRWYRQT